MLLIKKTEIWITNYKPNVVEKAATKSCLIIYFVWSLRYDGVIVVVSGSILFSGYHIKRFSRPIFLGISISRLAFVKCEILLRVSVCDNKSHSIWNGHWLGSGGRKWDGGRGIKIIQTKGTPNFETYKDNQSGNKGKDNAESSSEERKRWPMVSWEWIWRKSGNPVSSGTQLQNLMKHLWWEYIVFPIKVMYTCMIMTFILVYVYPL